MQPELFLDMARALERACFDYILLEDSSYVGESYGGSTEIYLKNGDRRAAAGPVGGRRADDRGDLAHRHRPDLRHLRLSALSAGPPHGDARPGVGRPRRLEHRHRQLRLRGDEFRPARHARARPALRHGRRVHGGRAQACGARWEPGAVIADRKSGILVDHTKVHAVNYEGRYYKTRGPLNSGPAPQGRPVIAQAGGSPRGRQFAAAHADTIVAHAKGIDGMKAYRDDVRKHMAAQGRNPDDCKVLFLINPILGETMEEAQERKKQRAAHGRRATSHAAPGAFRQGHQHRLRQVRPRQAAARRRHHQRPPAQPRTVPGAWPSGRSIRETMASFNAVDLSVELCRHAATRSPRAWARSWQEVGGDGFLFSMPNVNRRTLAEIEDGLVPALQDRGLVRKAYEHKQFRDNLLAY